MQKTIDIFVVLPKGAVFSSPPPCNCLCMRNLHSAVMVMVEM